MTVSSGQQFKTRDVQSALLPL